MSQGILQRFQSCRLVEQQQAAARAHLERQRSKFGLHAHEVHAPADPLFMEIREAHR